MERKVSALIAHIPPPPNPLISRFSRYSRMIRSIAFCLRFARNARKQIRSPSTLLSIGEIEIAKTALVKIVQAESYADEIRSLQKGHSVSKHSSLKLLSPFLDSAGIIRVGGRLRRLRGAYSAKHPIVLPGFHHFTRMLIVSYHERLLHGGIALTLASVRDEFWPTNGKRAVRSVIRTCFRCIRTNPRPMSQPTGQLPLARITPSRPFLHTGVDYCGPVFVKYPNRRTSPIKAYIAIFVCFSTKAVHIELVGDLTTASFLSALRRFISRRNRPLHIYSDNATNFSGAKNELNALFSMLRDRAEIERIEMSLASEGIQWHMIPPRAPNFGGLWEAAVKVAKRHLIRQVGTAILFYEDLVTILTQIEGCMNSRPLCQMSDDPNDYEALTPGHFLTGSSLQALPDHNWTEAPINRLNRFQLITQKTQQFWYRWTTEYLRELHRLTTADPAKVILRIGQIVILRDQQLPPIRWPLARIQMLHPGEDGVTRVVTLRTVAGTFKRSVGMLCPLPNEETPHVADQGEQPDLNVTNDAVKDEIIEDNIQKLSD